ncbi:MAG: hypothetical protein U0231_04545 [Nitrospiraceae bacterium]
MNYTTVNIPAATVSFTRNAVNTSVILFAQGDAHQRDHPPTAATAWRQSVEPNAGGLGGPGGLLKAAMRHEGSGNTIGLPGRRRERHAARNLRTPGSLHDFALDSLLRGSGGNGGLAPRPPPDRRVAVEPAR